MSTENPGDLTVEIARVKTLPLIVKSSQDLVLLAGTHNLGPEDLV